MKNKKLFLSIITIFIALSLFFKSKAEEPQADNILFYSAIISKEGEIIATIPITKENIYETEKQEHFFQIFVSDQLLEPHKEARRIK